MGGSSPLTISNISIPQLDGNISILSQSEYSFDQSELSECKNFSPTEYEGEPIPVYISEYKKTQFSDQPTPPPWYERYIPRKIDKMGSKNNRKVVRRDKRIVLGEFLPTIGVSNVRSLIPKIENVKKDILERSISLLLLSEVWEKANCKKQQFEMEKMCQMDGLKYISTPRLKKRGGGAAIIVNLRNFAIEKIPVHIPNNLEVVWGLMRPKMPSSTIREYIVASFYSPPHYKKNSQLLDHLLSTTHFLLSKYPKAGVVIGGDKNNLNISSLLSGIPKLRQLVTQPTHRSKILDIILTNISPLYAVPEIVPPVSPDNPQVGVPSDHHTAVATPLAQCGEDSVKQSGGHVMRTYRPLPDSGIREFGRWFCTEEWGCLAGDVNPTEQVEELESQIGEKLEIIFPLKTVKIKPNVDVPFYTKELKILDRQVKREYRKNSKSVKYQRLKKLYNEKYQKAANAYLEKNVRSLKEDDPGKAYKSLKKMGAQPGDCSDEGAFQLQSHIEDNLSEDDSVERIANYFSQISQEFPPLNFDLLPNNVKSKLSNPSNQEEIPQLSDYQIYEQIKKSKKPKSSVPGDLPRRLVQEFAPEMAAPAGLIFRNIMKTGHWPRQWRLEYGTPLQKKSNPVDEDDLRVISLTSYMSKQFEQFVVIWLLEHISDKLDWGQYGGRKATSISHYLIDFVNFILYNQDLAVPHSVIAMMIDFSKAFNRINHNIILTILSDMGVPGWLLKIVAGFLKDREMILRYKGRNSSKKRLPGGGPQGTKLGLFLFLILINAAGFGYLEKHIGKQITEKMSKRKPIENIHLKYVDDMSIAQSINLPKCLIPNPNPQRPFEHHDHTSHILPSESYSLQEQLNKLVEYCETNQMKINEKKSKVMIFNTRKMYDGRPRLAVGENEFLEIVESYKLLGVIVRSDLKWSENTDYMCKKGYSRLWLLRRLKSLGANQSEMLDVYSKQVRSILELAVPVWNAGLTKHDSNQIERVQRSAFHIILGEGYACYENALETLGYDRLSSRRLKLCEKFATRAVKHDQFKNWFSEKSDKSFNMNTRSKKAKLKYNEVLTRTNRYQRSPIPFLTNILNSMNEK